MSKFSDLQGCQEGGGPLRRARLLESGALQEAPARGKIWRKCEKFRAENQFGKFSFEYSN